MDSFKVIPAQPLDSSELTKISFEAKRYWGYPEEWIQLWRNDLTITPEYLSEHFIYKLIADDTIKGFIAFEKNENELEITHLWITPSSMHLGIGRILLDYSLGEIVKNDPIKRVVVISDPNAEGFYKKVGFKKISEIESLPKGRVLPVLEKLI